MSTYYSFYAGYRTTDNIFHAFGPFDKYGNLRPILDKSRSFISDIVEDFNYIKYEELDDLLKEKFVEKDTFNEDGKRVILRYLPLNELPSTNFIKNGYFKIDEIEEYICLEETENIDFYFSEHYSIKEYNILLHKAVKTNNEEEIARLKEFDFFSYPDYNSKEFDSFILDHAFSYNGPFDSYHIENKLKDHGEELKDRVVLMSIS